ncbi:MAG: ABC transporter ATP-binding protein [Erysipelothrix sp.]|nr:ABC transporter ATP-binding protein [Erysipelothrix sp.]
MFKLFKKITFKEWIQIAISIIFIVLQVFLDLRLPDYMSEVTRLVQTPGSEMSQILYQGGLMLLCVLGSVLAAVVVGYFAARVASSLGANLRDAIFNKVDSFSMEEMNHFSTPSLITRTTNDVNQIQLLITLGMQVVVKAPIMAVWAITKIYGKGFEWSMATVGAVVVLFVIMSIVMLLVLPKFKQMQVLTDNVNKAARETLSGLRVVRAYNAEGYQENKFEVVNEDLTSTQLFTSRTMSIMMPLITFTMSGLSLVIYWMGAYLINSAGLEDKLILFSDMVVFSSYAMQVIMAFMMLVMIFIILPRATVSAGRINEVLEREPSIKSGDLTNGLEGVYGEIEFRNVSFKYPDAKEYVLKDISFKVNQGETIAFIGSTGSGKSTIVNLIMRFYDSTEGEILIDGVNIQNYELSALYNKLGYVPQKAVLFSGSVESNVNYGQGSHNSSHEAVNEAVEIAQAKDFVEAMEKGYASNIARGGVNVSGGQKQRLAIARAIHRKPEVYIFDDSFSALDYRTDRVLRSALKEKTQGITSVIVAQRIGTIMDADQIVVLDEGRVVGKGRHEDLLRSCSVYQEIASSQFNEEELV